MFKILDGIKIAGTDFVDSSRNVTAGTLSGSTLSLSQTTGTSPMTISSTTLVSNLNADLLDGNHASAFYLATNPNGYTSNTGTVTSVGLSLPNIFSVTNSPVTTSGTLTAGLASQAANTVLAAPNGATGVPTFRTLVAADIPSHNHTSLTGVTSIGFSSEATDLASISTTINGTGTYFDFNLSDDNNNDWWRWRFTPSSSTIYDAMTLKPSANGVADLAVAGTVTGTRLISSATTGTSPLTISSTTLVSNLNADMLDGNHASAFSLSGHTHAFSDLTSKPTTLSGYGITDAINSSLLGANSGVATLDSSGKVPSTQLPSYVDDVLEYTNQASFPATGETGKIYVALDVNKTYRWSGTAYIEISASPGSTDSVTEGSTNLYFTNARARASLSSTTGSAGYNSSTGVITIPGTSSHISEGTNLFYTDSRARSALSFVAGSGGYNSATGVITIPTNTNQLTNGAGFLTTAVTSLTAGTYLSASSSTGAVTISTNATSANTASTIVARDSNGNFSAQDIYANTFQSTNNGNGTNFKVGDDAWIGDINTANTIRITGNQDATSGYIVFGNSNTTALGRTGTGALTYGGNTIHHDGNFIAGTNYVSPSGNITGTAANVTGTVAIANGGTGATSASSARTNLGLGTAAISSSTDFVGRKSLSNTGLDYTDFVIPLCSLDNTSTSANYYAYGSFYMKRSNILSDQMTKIDVICGKNYNSNTPVFSINKTNSSNLVRPVTFTYNSVMYFGLHFYITASSYDGSCLFFGTASDTSIINGIQIYNNNTSTIINSEIYNSLSFLTDTTYNKAHEFYKSPIIRPVGGSTTYKIWNETNDGAGSGLDADTLDGNHASAFYLATNPSGYTSNNGTVTSVSVASANGFAGTVATSTTTPAITLSTTITGMLKGNGTAISAATAGTDYVVPSGNITGSAGSVANSLILKFDNGTTEGTDLYTFNGSSAKTINFISGNAITISEAAGSVTINHTDTSAAANLSASSRTYVTGLTFDTYGHVTGYTTGTETVTDTNTVTRLQGTGGTLVSGDIVIQGTGLVSTSQSGNTITISTTATSNTGTVTSVAAGSYLTGGTITTSGTLAVDATSANTASKVVARDANGNFSAGTITATNFAPGVTIQTTTGTTQTLTANSSYTQVYNGTTPQTIKLASATSGASFRIINNTSASLYIITNGGASILTQIAGVAVEYIVIDNTVDAASSWMPIYLNRSVLPAGTDKFA